MKREKSRQTIYLVAGLYLVYLAYSMFQSIRGGEVPQDQTALMILFGVLFALLGVGIAAVCGRRLYRMSREEKEEAGREEAAGVENDAQKDSGLTEETGEEQEAAENETAADPEAADETETAGELEESGN